MIFEKEELDHKSWQVVLYLQISKNNITVSTIFYLSKIQNLTLGIIIVTRKAQSRNTGRLNTNLYVMLKFTEQPKTPGMTSKKSAQEISSFAEDFVLIWMKQRLIWFNLQRDGTRNGLSNIKETFAESLQLQMSVLHQRMSIFQSSMLVSQVHMMAGQNVKKKYLMCHIPIKMLKQHATPNSSLNNLKIYSSKR